MATLTNSYNFMVAHPCDPPGWKDFGDGEDGGRVGRWVGGHARLSKPKQPHNNEGGHRGDGLGHGASLSPAGISPFGIRIRLYLGFRYVSKMR